MTRSNGTEARMRASAGGRMRPPGQRRMRRCHKEMRTV
jgi:hypothetical protein